MKVISEHGPKYLPERAHDTDAGLDIKTPYPFHIMAGDSAMVFTGIHVQLPAGCAGLLVSKSGLNVKDEITSTGLIDEGYTGEIIVKLYNHGDKTKFFDAGDKVSQLVVIPVRYEPVEAVDHFEGETARGNKGFGSTGR